MKKDFSTKKETVTGIKVVDIKFLTIPGKWVSFILNKDGNKSTTCMWHKTGKCINRLRPELDLE